MSRRRIRIYASSSVNANATMLVSLESVEHGGYTQYFYQVEYTVGNAHKDLSEQKVSGLVDYLFDVLWYNKPLEEMESDEQIRYKAYAEVMFRYFQINLFYSALSHDDYTYEHL